MADGKRGISIGLSGVLWIVLVILKITGDIGMSWFWIITGLIWIPIGMLAIIFGMIFVIGVIGILLVAMFGG